MKNVKAGGGWPAIRYTLRMAQRVGWLKLWKAMRSKNACKTCALGMGGQMGGMVNEGGHFPEVCKKSFQAMVSDMQGGISPAFLASHGFSQLQALSPRELESCGRIVTPLFAGPNDAGYRAISWDQSLEILATRLIDAGPEKMFFYASGRSSNEAGFLLQLLARLAGTNYVNNCSYYCHQASGVGMTSALGTSTGTVRLEDVERADLYVLIGGNPASNHPRLMRTLMQIRRRGGRVIVVNPARELGLTHFRVPSDLRSLLFGTKIASQYVQPHIGGDLALLAGVAKSTLERQGEAREFIHEHTEGFEDFRATIERLDWEEIVRGSGVSREEIEAFAESYRRAERVVFGWTMGVTHHLHGVQNVQMIVNLALLRGMVGRPHAGLMPIRGHSNVQGVGSVGVTPQLKAALLERFEKRLGVTAPRSPGMDTMACMQAAESGRMQAALCLGGNLFGSNPDAQFAKRSIERLGFVAYLNTTLNTGHAWGRAKETLVLPVLARDEEPEPTTQESMFSFVRLSAGGIPRHRGPRSEVSLLSELGRRMLGDSGPIDWSKLASHQAIRELIADMIPDYERVAELGRGGREFHIPGRGLTSPAFPTANGKARFHAIEPPKFAPLGDRQLRLMTVRGEGQFNTVVYEDEDLYRGQERRDVILMNRTDIGRMGLAIDQPVRVRSAVGEMRRQLVRQFEIRAGAALMYYPEANILVPRDVDPLSKTPAFKSIVVSIEPETTDLFVARSPDLATAPTAGLPAH